LKESEGRLAEAQKFAHIGSYDWNIATNKEYWSDELYRIFRLDPQFELNHNTFLNYIHPEDLEYVSHAINEALNGKPYNLDYRIILPYGEERVIYSQGGVFFDVENTPIRMRGIVQDITEQRKAEDKIRHLANIVESSNDAIGTFSLECIITSWNKGAELVYGYSADEILGKTVSSLAPPHLTDETKKFSELVREGKKIVNYETIRLRKDGKIINVSVTLSPVLDVHGKLNAVSFITRDITKSKEAEGRLLESEEKYRNIVETANEGIIITNNKNRITYVNKKFADMLRYTIEEVNGSSIWSFISEEYKPNVKNNLKQRKTGKNGSYELKLISKDGSPIWTLLNAKPLFDEEGKYVGAMSMLTDITKRKEAEEAMALIEIARKQEIHHRIKNNLQVISSLLDLQTEQFNNRECIKDSEVLEAFKESQNRVISMALIHEELHKGEGFETLNFSSYVKELVDNLLLTYRLGNNNINLNVDLDQNVFLDMYTAVPLGIIINELVSNSLKHAFPDRNDGEIRINLRKEEGNTNFVLTVSDNGVGIPEDLDIENLESLGLQLVTTLVDQLDGELELKRDNGTEFTLRFTVTGKSDQASAP